jgi:hypothetical protein
MNKKPILLPLAAALAAAFPAGVQAKAVDAGLSVGRTQAAITQTAGSAPTPLLALPNASPAIAELGHYSHHSHHSHHSHRSHYSSSGGGHYSHSSHSSHYSSS